MGNWRRPAAGDNLTCVTAKRGEGGGGAPYLTILWEPGEGGACPTQGSKVVSGLRLAWLPWLSVCHIVFILCTRSVAFIISFNVDFYIHLNSLKCQCATLLWYFGNKIVNSVQCTGELLAFFSWSSMPSGWNLKSGQPCATLCNTLVGAGARNQDKITIEATGGGAWAPSTESSHLPFCCTTASVPLLSVQLLHNNWCASVQCKCTVHVELKHVSTIRWLWPDAKWKDSRELRSHRV